MSGKEDVGVTRFRQYLQVRTEQPDPDYGSCCAFLEKYATELNLSCKIVEPHPNRPFVIITWVGQNEGLPSLLLYSHTDVVPVFKEHWKYDPFSAFKDEDGNIYARGSQDMKCVGVQYLEAIRRLKNEGIRQCSRTVHVVFGPDEEIGSEFGMKIFVDTEDFRILNHGISLDEGIASEDNVYRVYYAERRAAWLKVTCRGNPGHGSKFIENTAAEKLRRVINRFLGFRETEKEKLKRNSELTLGDVTTVNMTKLEGGVQINVVPAELSVYFDIRVPPTVDGEVFVSQIEDWLREAGSDINHEWILKPWDSYVTSTSSDNPWWMAFCRVMEKMELNFKKEVCFGTTDSRFLRAKGFPALNFSPMVNTPQLLHDHNEYLNENVFLKGVEIYRNLIWELANLPSQ